MIAETVETLVEAAATPPNPATPVRATAAQTRLRSHGARATVLSEEALLTLLDSRAAVESTIDRLIGILDMLDVTGADLEEADDEDGGDAEPSLGASELYMDLRHFWHDTPTVDRATSQVHWTEGCDGRDLENDPSLAEPYLSVCEWDGRGDNWGRSGHATIGGRQTDVEDVNEDGGGEYDEPYSPYARALEPAGGARV